LEECFAHIALGVLQMLDIQMSSLEGIYTHQSSQWMMEIIDHTNIITHPKCSIQISKIPHKCRIVWNIL